MLLNDRQSSFLLVFLLYLWMKGLYSCQGQTPLGKEGTQVPSHKIWDGLLKKYVHQSGKVDYQNFQKDSTLLGDYLNLISQNPPDRKRWSREEQLAYWINSYNAFTVKLILGHYPLGSIKELHPTPYIPGINTIWQKKILK